MALKGQSQCVTYMLCSRSSLPDAIFPGNIIIGGFCGRAEFYAVPQVFPCWNYIDIFSLCSVEMSLNSISQKILDQSNYLGAGTLVHPKEDNSRVDSILGKRAL